VNSEAVLLITDSSIWIDLIKGGLLDAFFRLPYLFCTSSYTMGYESVGVNWDTLEARGLQFLGLSGEENAHLYTIRQSHHHLSVPDIASFIIALRTSGILLTGDQNLRKLASVSVEVHGFLWVMEQLVNENIVLPVIAIEILERLLKDPNVRLPKKESELHLKKWHEKINIKKGK